MKKILLFSLIFISSSFKITAQYSITSGGTIAEILIPATGVKPVTSLSDDDSVVENTVSITNNDADENHYLSTNQGNVTMLTNNFVTRWDLTKIGSGTNQISFGVSTTGTVNYTWQQVGGAGTTGSGTFTGSTATITGLPTEATIDLSIQPTNFRAFFMNNGTDKSRLTDVKEWGGVAWTSMQNSFRGCNNLNITATDIPNLAGVANMNRMFSNCSILNGPTNINSWNTSIVTNMTTMFFNASAFNQNISSWNTSAVTNMSSMFFNASAFNQNISSWNTSAVTNMSSMFSFASSFNQNIGSWNTASVTDMSYMFYVSYAFNQNIGSWNIANATDMTDIFRSSGINVSNYDAILTAWNTEGYTNKNLVDASPLKYCASTVRNILTTPIASGGKGWTITGDALNSVCTCALNISQATGNWGTAITWSCGHVPLATEPVQIASGHTVTLDVNGTAKSLDLRGIINKQATKVLTIQGN
jgi:surface protein